jgi:hypothetical protein
MRKTQFADVDGIHPKRHRLEWQRRNAIDDTLILKTRQHDVWPERQTTQQFSRVLRNLKRE